MATRTSIGRSFQPFPRVSRAERQARLRQVADVLPRGLVFALSLAVFCVAASSAVWTIAVDQPATFAELGAPAVTGTITAN